jgi:methyl-accepting chemotaxis protein
MKISSKLTIFFVAVLILFAFLCISLVSQVRLVSDGYDGLLSSPIPDMDAARVIQVQFKKQVQEWKDILLRGHTPDDLAKYTKQFHDDEALVQSGAKALAARVADPDAKSLLEQFLAAHLKLSESYKTAYDAYVGGNADFKAADKIVRGQDRPPTDLFDAVVARLDARVKASVEAQRTAVHQNLVFAVGLSAALLLVLSIMGFITIRSVLVRLAGLKKVSDHLARADIEGLVIDISGKDEIGEFAESMKGVHAAITELLSAAA